MILKLDNLDTEQLTPLPWEQLLFQQEYQRLVLGQWGNDETPCLDKEPRYCKPQSKKDKGGQLEWWSHKRKRKRVK